MEKLEKLPQWVNLKKHYCTVSKLTLRELFSQDILIEIRQNLEKMSAYTENNLLTTLNNKTPSAYLDSPTHHLLKLYMESKSL